MMSALDNALEGSLPGTIHLLIVRLGVFPLINQLGAIEHLWDLHGIFYIN